MSHEIRTPITGVLGMIGLLQVTRLSLRQAEYLDVARSSADSLLSLLNDILDISKMEAGRLDLASYPFSLRQCVTDAVRIFEVRMQEKGLELITKVEPNVPDGVVGDFHRLRQVIVNLVGNALKFTDAGQVLVRVGLDQKTSSEIVIVVQVSDTGIGIPADKRQLIFEPFRQVDGSTKRQHGGAGLGLSISARLVKLMGGSIGLSSEVGKGSTFLFTVKLAPAPEGALNQSGERPRSLPSPSAGAESKRTGLRILLAEDNVVNQKVISELIRQEGHDIDVVTNGADAVAAIQAEAFDLLLMDVQMPVMDGFEATRAIRLAEKATAQRTPIVAMTAHAMKDDRQKCIEAGMDDYLSKPVDVVHLRAMLEKWSRSAVCQSPHLLEKDV